MTALVARVRGLSPFGPIFGKELRVTARRKRSYVLRVLYLAALLLTMLFVWSASRFEIYGPGGQGVAAKAQAQERLGTIFFGAFLFFTVVAMALIGPILTATAISSERLGRTLNVLLMTPITAWQVVSGKLLSRLLIAFTLIGLSLPVLALSRLLGGVELSQMVGAVCLAATVALHSAAIGLFFSTLMRRAFAVILLAYATIGFFQAFVPFVGVTLFHVWSRGSSEVNWSYVNWMMAMVVLVEPQMGRRAGIGAFGSGLEPWAVCSLIYLALTAALVLCSGLLLRWGVRREGAGTSAPDPTEYIPVATALVAAPPQPPPLATGAPATPPPLPATDPPRSSSAGDAAPDIELAPAGLDPAAPTAPLAYSAPRARGPRAGAPRDVSDNPVLWREVRRPLTARRWQATTFTVAAIALLLVSYAACAAVPGNALGDNDLQAGYAVIFHGLLWLLVAVVSATSVAQEKEGDTWTLLLTTPVSGRTIVFGKAAGLLRRMMWPYALAAGHFAVFTLTGVIPPQAFVFILWVMIAFNSVWLATGIYLSLRLRTVTFAVILNLLLAVLVYPVVAAVLMVAGELSRSDMNTRYSRGGEAWSEQVAWYLPYTYLAIGVDGMDNRNPAAAWRAANGRQFWLPRDLSASPPGPNDPNTWTHPFYQRRVTLPVYLAVTFGVGAAYLLAALGILCWTAYRFDRIVGRAPQRTPVVPDRRPAFAGPVPA